MVALYMDLYNKVVLCCVCEGRFSSASARVISIRIMILGFDFHCAMKIFPGSFQTSRSFVL